MQQEPKIICNESSDEERYVAPPRETQVDRFIGMLANEELKAPDEKNMRKFVKDQHHIAKRVLGTKKRSRDEKNFLGY